MRNLVRTQNGTMIHSADCHMAKRGSAVPWAWADRASSNDVLRAVGQFDYRQCSRCRPLARYHRKEKSPG